MSALTREAALTAAATLLRPLAGLMLKCGLTWREFATLAKTAFVEAATEDYGIDGRPTNVSRVALLTGLARKEVRRLRDIAGEPLLAAPVSKTTDATQVLSAWHLDPAWQDAAGAPRLLEPDAFAALCRQHCSDVPASATLKELLRVGAVRELADGRLEVLSRYYQPTGSDPQWVMMAGEYLADLGDTIAFNVDREAQDTTRFLGRAIVPAIPAAAVPEYHRFLETTGQQFLEQVDAWLEARRCDDADSDGDAVRLGVGVFFIQGGARPVAPPEQFGATGTR